jgi:hypothetical protein
VVRANTAALYGTPPGAPPPPNPPRSNRGRRITGFAQS